MDGFENERRACEIIIIVTKIRRTFINSSSSEKTECTAKETLAQSDGRGRRNRLTKDEEKMIVEEAIEFQNNGTPLDRTNICVLVETLVDNMCGSRQKEIGFVNNRAGKKWLSSFQKKN